MKRAFLIALFGLAFAGQVFAQPVLVNANSRLEWDAVVATDATTYQLFISTTTGDYDLATPAGEVDIAETSEMIVDLSPVEGTTYYAVVRAVDAAGNVSGLSNEVSFQLDSTPPDTPPNFRIVVTIVVQQ